MDDLVDSKLAFRLPLTKSELSLFLRHETVFRRKSQLDFDTFCRSLFPVLSKTHTGVADRGASESSSEDDKSTHSAVTSSYNLSFGASSIGASLRSHQIAANVRKLDKELKEKLSHHFVGVRKAFLELDQRYSGYITAQDLAKFLGA